MSDSCKKYITASVGMVTAAAILWLVRWFVLVPDTPSSDICMFFATLLSCVGAGLGTGMVVYHALSKI